MATVMSSSIKRPNLVGRRRPADFPPRCLSPVTLYLETLGKVSLVTIIDQGAAERIWKA